MSDTGFDYIIVGAGSAGCVMANRLSADPSNRVALIEAGSNDNWIWFHIPVGYLFAIGNPRADWCLKTEPVPGLGGRALNYPRGKVLGGSSAINAMIYMRGQAEDYDAWRDLGLPGWGWSDVMPSFIRHEDHFLGANKNHGAGGEWRVDHPRMTWDVLDRFTDAAEASGIPRTPDFNTGSNEGVAYFQLNQKNGRRWSSARGFLKPVLNRKNLTLFKSSQATRLIVKDGRATGLVIHRDGQDITLLARKEVVLCAGAIATPHLLQISGIGPAALLASHGVPVVKDMPGVGENLQDHLQIRPIYKVHGTKTMNTEYQSLFNRAMMGLQYLLFRRGPLTMAPSQLGAFTRSSPDQARPNVQMHVQPLSLDKFGDPLHTFGAMTVSICNVRPSSRGHVHLQNANPFEAPAIQPNYLDTQDDRDVGMNSLKLVRKIMAAHPMAQFNPQEYLPGVDIQSDADLTAAAGRISSTIFHPVGTAKMGAADDIMAVTDHRLKVRGIAGLRIADASVMPLITSGNTNSPTMMIAERAAGFILEDNR